MGTDKAEEKKRLLREKRLAAHTLREDHPLARESPRVGFFLLPCDRRTKELHTKKMRAMRQGLQPWGAQHEVSKWGAQLDVQSFTLARDLGHVTRTQSARGPRDREWVRPRTATIDAASRAECSFIDADDNDDRLRAHRKLALEDPMHTLFPPPRDMSVLWALEVCSTIALVVCGHSSCVCEHSSCRVWARNRL